jgi:hypothetical protein
MTDEMYADDDTEEQMKYVGLLNKEIGILEDKSILSCI